MIGLLQKLGYLVPVCYMLKFNHIFLALLLKQSGLRLRHYYAV